jgi:cytochrome c oxidase assembly factor CtaG
MWSGILIATFVGVGVLHFVSMRTMKLSETKNTHFRKVFWYFYGIFFMLSGGHNLIEKGDFNWGFTLQFIIG